METTPSEGTIEEVRRELKRAYLLVSWGNFDEAIEVCRGADQLAEPAHHLPRTMIGNFLVAKGEVGEALKVLRQVTREFPEEALPQIHFSEACYLAGRKRQGDRAFSKACDLDDGSTPSCSTSWRPPGGRSTPGICRRRWRSPDRSSRLPR